MVPAGARCGAHVEVAAVDVCQRCGRFLCGDCVQLSEDDAWCADCVGRVNLPASKLAKAGLGVTGLAYAAFALLFPNLRAPLFALLIVAVPGPAALAAMVMGIIEWRRIRAGLASARGRRWALATLVLATPMFLLMAVLVAWGLSIAARLME